MQESATTKGGFRVPDPRRDSLASALPEPPLLSACTRRWRHGPTSGSIPVPDVLGGRSPRCSNSSKWADEFRKPRAAFPLEFRSTVWPSGRAQAAPDGDRASAVLRKAFGNTRKTFRCTTRSRCSRRGSHQDQLRPGPGSLARNSAVQAIASTDAIEFDRCRSPLALPHSPH